jgi:succinate-acetate transporter protein
MSTPTTTRNDHLIAETEPPVAAPVDAPAPPSTAFFAGAPAMVGVPTFVAGSVALAIVLVGYVSGGAVGAPIAIITAATGLGLIIATLWAVALGQSIVASIFAIFAGFWLSYSALVLGLLHNWFTLPPTDVTHTIATFQITWLVVIGLLTLATLRLPLAFTAVFVLIDATLAFLIASTVNANTDLSKIAGYLTFAFAAVGAYIYLSVSSAVTGGPEIPLGRPVFK